MKMLLVLPLAAMIFPAFADRQPFSRYEPILKRQMFGDLPPDFDPNVLPTDVQKSSRSGKELTKEQEQLKSAIRFSVINITADGQTEVGFSDNSDPKAPRHYFLKAGETSGDGKWTVREADAEKSTMTVVQGEIEVTLSLGGNSANDANATARAGGQSAAPDVPARRGEAAGGFFASGSFGARRRARLQQEREQRAKDAEAAAAREAERQQREEADKQERAEMNQRLQELSEELKRNREESKRQKAEAEAEQKDDSSDAQNDTE